MNNSTLGLLIGGLIPALFYGLSAIAMKAGAGFKVSTSNYMMIIGVVIFLTGLAIKPWLGNTEDDGLNLKAIAIVVASGLFWALGTTLVNFAIVKFDSPIALLTPLYNMNTLVAVLGGMILFAEWKTVNSLPVFIGTALVVCGGILLSRA